MPTLQEKILQLKLHGAMQVRHAQWWQRQIAIHGEEKTTAFYKHIGLNHLDDSPINLTRGSKEPEVHVYVHAEAGEVLEKKATEWEGLTLSREPKEHEKIAVKGIAQAQESAKNSISTVLLSLREILISDGLEGVSTLEPSQYHTLVLDTPAEIRQSLRDRLITTYRQGRRLVASELSRTKQDDDEDDEEFDDLDTLTDLTDSRVANEVQSRITGAAARFALLGLAGAALLSAIQRELADGSVSYIDRASTGLANKVINIGRGDEARARNDEWGRVEYSALLDQNVCGPCAAEDGQEAATEDELTPVPNPECEGGDWCRCFHVFIAEGSM